VRPEAPKARNCYSVLYCLPNTLAEEGSVGTGTGFRPDRLFYRVDP
jgi:hypothetical protein